MAEADAKTSPAETAGGLKARVTSALVFVPAILAVVWLGDWLFVVALMAAALVMVREWNHMTLRGRKTPLAVVEGLALVLALALAAIGLTVYALSVVGVAAAVAGVLAHRFTQGANESPLFGAVAVPYLGVPLIALVWLRTHAGGDISGAAAIFWLLALIWLCDTAAYFAGRSLGGPRLAPEISPNKTWSGAIAGGLAGGGVAMVAAAWQGWAPDWGANWGPMVAMAAAGIMLAAWSQLGDLAESYIKRRFGVKDSGDLIPGHGGLLDRLDSLLFAAPALAVTAYWLAR